MSPTTPQPPPVAGPHAVEVWPDLLPRLQRWGLAELATDGEARDALGRERYGTPLTTDNGRDHLVDAYQEALDLVVYLAAAALENRIGWHMVRQAADLANCVRRAS